MGLRCHRRSGGRRCAALSGDCPCGSRRVDRPWAHHDSASPARRGPRDTGPGRPPLIRVAPAVSGRTGGRRPGSRRRVNGRRSQVDSSRSAPSRPRGVGEEVVELVALSGAEADRGPPVGPHVRPQSAQHLDPRGLRQEGHHVPGADDRVEGLATPRRQVQFGQIAHQPAGAGVPLGVGDQDRVAVHPDDVVPDSSRCSPDPARPDPASSTRGRARASRRPAGPPRPGPSPWAARSCGTAGRRRRRPSGPLGDPHPRARLRHGSRSHGRRVASRADRRRSAGRRRPACAPGPDRSSGPRSDGDPPQPPAPHPARPSSSWRTSCPGHQRRSAGRSAWGTASGASRRSALVAARLRVLGEQVALRVDREPGHPDPEQPQPAAGAGVGEQPAGRWAICRGRRWAAAASATG